MPGFTHLQSAQPVTFGHHLLAYVEMLGRDAGRLTDARKRLNESPLGSAALAGTPYPIDRDMTAKALGFDRPTANSLDAVSDRDFILETLGAGAICAMHLTRFAEELVIWSSAQFNFIRLSDKFTTGSSIMPQKRNPDAAELVRAKVGRIIGALTSLLVVMKGLPLAYSKDMQEDKEVAFDALDALSLSLAAMTGMVEDLAVNRERMRRRGLDGLFDRHRCRRLAGAAGQHSVPRCAPDHRPDRHAGRAEGHSTRWPDHRGLQVHRSPDRQPHPQGADRRGLGRAPASPMAARRRRMCWPRRRGGSRCSPGRRSSRAPRPSSSAAATATAAWSRPCITSNIEMAPCSPRTSMCTALAGKVGTPFYVYSAATLRRHVRVMREAFSGMPTLVAYAMKANSNQAVLKVIAGRGRRRRRGVGRRARTRHRCRHSGEQHRVLRRRQDRRRDAARHSSSASSASISKASPSSSG